MRGIGIGVCEGASALTFEQLATKFSTSTQNELTLTLFSLQVWIRVVGVDASRREATDAAS